MYFFFTNHGPQLFCHFSAKYLPTHFVRLFTLIGQSVHYWAFFANHVGKEIWKVFWQSCLCFRLFNYKHKPGVLQRPMLKWYLSQFTRRLNRFAPFLYTKLLPCLQYRVQNIKVNKNQ